jgi:DNA-binding PadR family transcriptional regulator
MYAKLQTIDKFTWFIAKDQGQMAKDKVNESLLDALRQALGEPREQLLFKSGKQLGLFTGKSGANAEAAARALREGLLEIVRTESKGKANLEWVRITPAGVTFLHDHESPLRALNDLKEMLNASQEAIPGWLGRMQGELRQLAARLSQEAEHWTQHLQSLDRRVDEALKRIPAGSNISNGMASLVPWAADALAYLDRRQAGTHSGACSLPELFAALKQGHDDLSLTGFHNGLRRLQDGKVVRLLPFADSPEKLSEPEYALLDGGAVLYYVEK